MSVLIIDYKMGNIGSIQRALEECGADAFISSDPKDLGRAERFILPGVGSFNDGMTHLKELGWIPEIKAAAEDHIPMLGICLGMQLLASKGYEGGECEGLNLVPGEVKRFETTSQDVRIPHIGWNEVYPESSPAFFDQILAGTDFYFVHSYHFFPKNQSDVIAMTPYCGKFVSAVQKDSVIGVQFHPEKSSKPGFQLLKNFLKLDMKVSASC